MINFYPFQIIINGNTRDDEVYAQATAKGGLPPSIADLNKIELEPASGKDAEAYEEKVFSCLVRMGAYNSGRLVLAATLNLAKPIYIVPLGERDLPFGYHSTSCAALNAYVKVIDKEHTHTRIRFSPFERSNCPTPVGDPDVVLLHELVHAARPAQVPILKAKPTNDDWRDLEEFFADMVENVYRSERRDPILKGGLGSGSRDGTRHNMLHFLSDSTIRARIEQAYEREDLAKKLARHSEIAFNPFALVRARAN